jgi:hypothetical protein
VIRATPGTELEPLRRRMIGSSPGYTMTTSTDAAPWLRTERLLADRPGDARPSGSSIPMVARSGRRAPDRPTNSLPVCAPPARARRRGGDAAAQLRRGVRAPARHHAGRLLPRADQHAPRRTRDRVHRRRLGRQVLVAHVHVRGHGAGRGPRRSTSRRVASRGRRRDRGFPRSRT